MELQEAISHLDELDEDAIISVKRPWTATAECQVSEPDDRFALPERVKAAGFDYFLEVHVAKEVVGVFGDRAASLDDKVRLLIHYAENDAYPEWVYEDT